MPFPSHDAYWAGVADFLDTHLTPDDDILAPKEFEYRFVHCFRYTISHTVPASGFQWIILHKGMLEKVAIAFLLDAAKHLHPAYANPVFVVLSSHTNLPPIPEKDNNDLIDFNQKLRSLVQSNRSKIIPPSQPTPVLSLHTPQTRGVTPSPTGTTEELTSPQPNPIALYPPPPNSSIKVSVITVCRNAAVTIEKTIQQIAAQTYPNIEYIVVDGASDDETLAVCDRYSSTITTLVSETDEGIYQAMNKGIGLATGNWLYFANADDYLFDPYVIQDFVAYIHNYPDADVIYGDHEARFPDGNASIYPSIAPEQMLEAIICFQPGCLLQPACLFHSKAFEQVGGFSEAYGIASDYKWFLEALQVEALTFHHAPRTVVSYAHGGRSGNIRPLFEEIFDIQSQNPLCQESSWLQRRSQALQQDFIHKYERMEELNRQLSVLNQQLNNTQQLVEIRDRHLTQRKQRFHSIPRQP
ncbi:MAG: glycosyltransferase [Merismopedia sp. SIO2A8]|nr:glycosyltransferase [Merismopedia sp. SIO2A8]